MDKLQLRACGKVNLFLEILGIRSDGYHDLCMVLQSIDLADRVTLTPARTISLRCAHPLVPTDPTNLAWKAAELMQRTAGLTEGVEILIDKRIPVAAGLAGGSTNAAAVLVGLNILWQLGYTHKQLEELGSQLGSDIPFCIGGGTVLGTGRGDELTPLQVPGTLHLVLAKPVDLQVSTPWAYRTYREKYLAGREPARASSREMIAAILVHDVGRIATLLFNDLEAAILPAYQEVARLRQRFVDNGAIGALMSGSGPTVFGLAPTREAAEQLHAKMLGEPGVEVHLCSTVVGGVEVEVGG